MSFKITRHSGEYEKDSNLAGWLKSFVKDIETVAAASPSTPVTAIDRAREREREQEAYYASARGVLGQTKRFSSVEDAVKDMQERTGLNIYLGKLSSKEESNVKKASMEVSIPAVLQEYGSLADNVDIFLNNIIKTYQNASVIQLQDELLTNFRKLDLKAIYNDETVKYLSDKILQNKKPGQVQYNSGLGLDYSADLVGENSDWMAGLRPGGK